MARWTELELQFLRNNYRKKSTAEIAAVLGRGQSAVVAKITKLGISYMKNPSGSNIRWTPEADQFLRDHADNGWQWCADKMGRTVTSIHNRVRRLGIQLKMLKAGDLEKVRQFHRQGLVAREIGERLGVTDECIRRWLKLWKLPMNRRDEKNRMQSLRATLQAKFGVSSVSEVREIIRRKRRLAAFSISLQSLSVDLARNVKCRQN